MPSVGKWNIKLGNDLDHKEVEAVTIHYSIWSSSSGRKEPIILKLEKCIGFFSFILLNVLIYYEQIFGEAA